MLPGGATGCCWPGWEGTPLCTGAAPCGPDAPACRTAAPSRARAPRQGGLPHAAAPHAGGDWEGRGWAGHPPNVQNSSPCRLRRPALGGHRTTLCLSTPTAWQGQPLRRWVGLTVGWGWGVQETFCSFSQERGVFKAIAAQGRGHSGASSQLQAQCIHGPTPQRTRDEEKRGCRSRPGDRGRYGLLWGNKLENS